MGRSLNVRAGTSRVRYFGRDLYAARCAMLHTYSPQMRKNQKRIGYHDGSHHRYGRDIDPSLIMLSVPMLKDDFCMAVSHFLQASRAGPHWAFVRSRFEDMFQVFPFSEVDSRSAHRRGIAA